VSAHLKMPNVRERTVEHKGDSRASEADFSLVLGGPFYQLYLRTRLAKPSLELLWKRIFGISLFCWLPLLLLSTSGGHAFGGVRVPFLYDVEAHAKFLVALPLLIGAELTVHSRLRSAVEQFYSRNIIAPEDHPRFEEIKTSTMRLRNSVLLELLLLLLAYTVANWVWRTKISLGVATWYAGDTYAHLTAAGYWYAFVSMPLLRFIIFRWYFRLFLWYRFLWRIRGLQLHLNLFHPDRAGGLGFLSGSVFGFAPILVAQTSLLAAFIADRIWNAGATLPGFKLEIAGVVAFLMLLVLIPLCFFVMHLHQAGRTAHHEYGVLASHYVDDFRRKWVQDASEQTEPLLGTSDIQSLADLGNAHEVIEGMRLLPFGKHTVIRLGVMLILPLLPLTLIIMPFDEIVRRLLKLAF
jgi:hypothetical protein